MRTNNCRRLPKKEKLISDIDIEIKIAKQGLRKRDSDLITFNPKQIKKWNPGIQEQWLQIVNIL